MSKLREFYNRFRCVLEDKVLTAPCLGYVTQFNFDEEVLTSKMAELKLQGYTSLGQIFNIDELASLHKIIDNAVSDRIPGIIVDWSDKVEYWTIRNPLRLDQLIINSAMNPLCIALAERYFGRMPYLSDVDMRRIPPANMKQLQTKGYSSSNWHRDTRGRQLKIMIYLTDVDELDSNFSFLPATHIGAHNRKAEYMASRFSDEEVNGMQIKPQEWYGKAGTAMLFDTNLIHRLRRKVTGSVRDTVTFYYTPGQNTWHLDFDESLVAKLPKQVSAIFGNPSWPFKRA